MGNDDDNSDDYSDDYSDDSSMEMGFGVESGLENGAGPIPNLHVAPSPPESLDLYVYVGSDGATLDNVYLGAKPAGVNVEIVEFRPEWFTVNEGGSNAWTMADAPHGWTFWSPPTNP